ncbi:unnamed protein product [Dicrocoelium dendriticum]|nr:unnamed protein product [Dicrocoelium dendriticum]
MLHKTHVRRVNNLVFAPLRRLYNQSWDSYTVHSPCKRVAHVQLNRPNKSNAMDQKFWKETAELFEFLQKEKSIRSVVLSGAGKHFSAGLDFQDFTSVFSDIHSNDPARFAFSLRKLIKTLQESFNWLEKCNKPVIAAIHGACIGGAVDMICAADIRYCSEDAWFQIKELELGIAADVGTLQRLPRLVGSESLARELIFTARRFDSSEALKCGFVSRVLKTASETVDEALRTAEQIASHTPVAVQTAKYGILFARDHGVYQGLDQMNARHRLSSTLGDQTHCSIVWYLSP